MICICALRTSPSDVPRPGLADLHVQYLAYGSGTTTSHQDKHSNHPSYSRTYTLAQQIMKGYIIDSYIKTLDELPARYSEKTPEPKPTGKQVLIDVHAGALNFFGEGLPTADTHCQTASYGTVLMHDPPSDILQLQGKYQVRFTGYHHLPGSNSNSVNPPFVPRTESASFPLGTRRRGDSIFSCLMLPCALLK